MYVYGYLAPDFFFSLFLSTNYKPSIVNYNTHSRMELCVNDHGWRNFFLNKLIRWIFIGAGRGRVRRAAPSRPISRGWYANALMQSGRLLALIKSLSYRYTSGPAWSSDLFVDLHRICVRVSMFKNTQLRALSIAANWLQRLARASQRPPLIVPMFWWARASPSYSASPLDSRIRSAVATTSLWSTKYFYRCHRSLNAKPANMFLLPVFWMKFWRLKPGVTVAK